MLKAGFDRARAAFGHSLAAAVAAALAYWVAKSFFGHPQPVFAAITALICLAPGIPDHIRQGINLLIGVTTGLVIGELALFVPYELGEIRLAVATFLAILVASSYGAPPVVPIQAGASALLVLLLGPQNAGFVRLVDVLVGAATGMAFALLFFRRRSAPPS